MDKLLSLFENADPFKTWWPAIAAVVFGAIIMVRSPLMSAISVKLMTFPWMWLFMKNPFEGAQCAIRLATDPKLKNVSGEYFNDCEIAQSSLHGRDIALAKKLYMQTIKELEKVTKLTIDKDIEGETLPLAITADSTEESHHRKPALEAPKKKHQGKQKQKN
uniref:Retinol dehydrogenase 14 n=1 Tax=Bactrocera dorsalis TaxID=27457 RepID=A0A034WFK7_BACDO